MPTIGQRIDNLIYKNTPINNTFQKDVAPGVFNFINPSARPKMKDTEYQLAYAGWVYACTNAIAERLADIDLHLQKKGSENWTDMPDHDALKILHTVNPFLSFTELMFSYAAYQELDGNSFWYVTRGAGGKVQEIWPLNPIQITIVKSKTDFIAGYVYKNDTGTEIPFEPDEIIHFKRFNPRDPYRGIGTVQAAGIAIDIDTFAAEWQRNFFGNSALPSGLLYSENTMSQEQYDRIRTNWDSRMKGVHNAHKLGIMEGGIKYQQLTPTSRDMQFSEGRKDTRDEILAIFRVPKTILGITEDVNLASAQATEYIFSKYVIKPKMKSFVESLNEYYLPMFKLDPQKFRFHFTDPVPENNEEKRADRNAGMQYGYITPNEARAAMNLEPLEGGDELYIPTTYAPITNSNVPEEEVNDNDTDAKSVKKNSKLILTKATNEDNPYIKEKIKDLHTSYLDLNTQLEKIVVTRMQEYKKSITRKDTSEDESSNDAYNYLIDNDEYGGWYQAVFTTTKDAATSIMEQGGKDAYADLKVDNAFDLANPRAQDYLNAHVLETTDSYTGTWKESIALILQEGMEQGLSNDKIADSLSELFFTDSDMRAMRIARTEAITSYANGSLEGYKQSGIITGKEWLPDAEACPMCLLNAGDGVIGLNEEFSGDVQCPAQHPNCECSILGVTNRDA